MSKHILFTALISTLALTGSGICQESFPSLKGISPPTRVPVLLDSRVEDPPVYSGWTAAPLPKTNDTVEFQIFLPHAAGKRAYGYILEFDNPDGRFTERFEIKTARTWIMIPFSDETGQTRFITTEKELAAPGDSIAPARSILFLAPPIVPTSGVIARVSLRAKQDLDRDTRLRVTVSVGIITEHHPVRILHYRGTQTLYWM